MSPCPVRTFSDIEEVKISPTMADKDQDVDDAKVDRWNDEEIHCRDSFGVVF